MFTFIKKIIANFLEKKQFIRGEINLNNRKGSLHKAWGHVFSNHLEGDYIEFGVYEGESFKDSIKIYLEFKSWLKNQLKSGEAWRIKVSKQSVLNKPIIFHGLDTFEGMPKNAENNVIFDEGNFKASEEYVKTKLKPFIKSNINYFLYKGTFKKSKDLLESKLKNRKIAIANIDCDIQESTTDALNTLEDYLQIGSILLLDDYNAFNANENLGQRKAFNIFSQSSKFKFEKFFSYHYSGVAFLNIGKK
tara:strand:+ start:810 stop:1553 length:744 start_codon:yes stop_codon:yes gene_type:complete